jgi:glutamate-1-semialdehyde 2,1-aminomutase
MAAALATLDILEKEDVCGHVWRLGERLIDGLNEAALRHGIPAVAYGEPLPPMPFLRFTGDDDATADVLRTTFFSAMFAHGVLMHPRHLWFISYAHRSEDIDRTLEAANLAFGAVAAHHAELL